jgi:hypothetical protein
MRSEMKSFAAAVKVSTLFLFAPFGLVTDSKAQFSNGPSAFCHVTDGTFTDCNPATTGLEEWSDVRPTSYSGGGVLYVNQNATRTVRFLCTISHSAPLP